jgi:hypothetical protein
MTELMHLSLFCHCVSCWCMLLFLALGGVPWLSWCICRYFVIA